MQDTPIVSIGLPVHNGAAFVAEAIESILAQTFTDFELVISDNASTDRTPEICRGYAAADRRIRFYRQETNIGAAPNFNLVFHRSSGKYFKWAAHDDLIRPTYLERCIAALEADPEAVLCQPVVEIVDAAGAREIYDHGAFGTDRPRQSDRLAARLRARRCTEVFGVIRRDALRGTALIGDHVGADRTLLVELALRGRFLPVPEILFVNRDHPERFTRRHRTLHAQAAWYAAKSGSQRRVLRTWILYSMCLDSVRRNVSVRAERRRCNLRILQSIAYRRRWFRLVMEPIEAIAPRAAAIEPWLFDLGAALKRTLQGKQASAP
jgi:glycosyltransferase involved in cell wall biosynthesis